MPISLGIGVRPTQLGGVLAFSPLSLSPHLWLDPSDLSTMFQERTGASATTPSVVDGVVGSFHDKSASGLWLTAPSDAARPILRSSGGTLWLEFDGVDDELTVAYGGNLSQPWERVSAFRKLDALPVGTNDTFLVGPASIGQLYITPAPELRIYSGAELTGLTAPSVGTDFVATERHNGASSRLAIDNGSYQTGSAGATAATGISIAGSAAEGGGFVQCRCYGFAQFNRTLTDDEIALLRTYLATKQGRVL